MEPRGSVIEGGRWVQVGGGGNGDNSIRTSIKKEKKGKIKIERKGKSTVIFLVLIFFEYEI